MDDGNIQETFFPDIGESDEEPEDKMEF